MQVAMLLLLVLSEDDSPSFSFLGVVGFFPQTIHNKGLGGGHFQLSMYEVSGSFFMGF